MSDTTEKNAVAAPPPQPTESYARLPPPYAVSEERVIRWLLQRRDHGDRSKWLGDAGFTLMTWNQLALGLMEIGATGELVGVDPTDWGPVYSVRGRLTAHGRQPLRVVTVWARTGRPLESRLLSAWPDPEPRR